MPAFLTTIAFDRATTIYLEKFQEECGHVSDWNLSEVHTIGDLHNTKIELKNVDDGDYALIVGINFERDCVGVLTLMKTNGNSEVILRKSIDLKPIIDSELADSPELDQLVDLPYRESDEPSSDDLELIEKVLMDIQHRRAMDLEDFLAPCLTDRPDFNLRLLTVLDYMSYPQIKNGVSSATPELSEHDVTTTHPCKSGYLLN